MNGRYILRENLAYLTIGFRHGIHPCQTTLAKAEAGKSKAPLYTFMLRVRSRAAVVDRVITLEGLHCSG